MLRLVQCFDKMLNPINDRGVGGGGGTKCPDPFYSAIAIFFSRKDVLLLFDFYYFGVRQILVKFFL